MRPLLIGIADRVAHFLYSIHLISESWSAFFCKLCEKELEREPNQ